VHCRCWSRFFFFSCPFLALGFASIDCGFSLAGSDGLSSCKVSGRRLWWSSLKSSHSYVTYHLCTNERHSQSITGKFVISSRLVAKRSLILTHAETWPQNTYFEGVNCHVLLRQTKNPTLARQILLLAPRSRPRPQTVETQDHKCNPEGQASDGARTKHLGY
jgi:hypothetical protein